MKNRMTNRGRPRRVQAPSHAGLTFPRSCQDRPHDPDWTALPAFGRYPQLRFSFAMRTTRSSISVDFLGRPHPRLPLPSYFCAINRRCQASRVSGVTIVAISRRSLLLSPLALAANGDSIDSTSVVSADFSTLSLGYI